MTTRAPAAYDAMMAETVRITSRNGDEVEAYLARPLAPRPSGGVVVIHHMPGYGSGTGRGRRGCPGRGWYLG